MTKSKGDKPKNPVPKAAEMQAISAERGTQTIIARNTVLQPVHIGFVNAYFAMNFNVVDAANSMNIPVKQARTWIEQDGPVADYISRRLARMSERVDVTLEEVVSLLFKEATREAESTSDKTVSHAARVSALQVLARLKGGFDKKRGDGRKVSVNINIGDVKGAPITIEGNSDE